MLAPVRCLSSAALLAFDGVVNSVQLSYAFRTGTLEREHDLAFPVLRPPARGNAGRRIVG
jgi:hypothetical protein